VKAERSVLPLLLLALALGAFAGRDARAQDTTITPPRLLAEEPVHYPDGATGDAEVLLEVVVGAEGQVADVTVVEGAEPFATTATETVRQYRFEPAERAGKPVRARIRIAIRFSPPPPPRRSLVEEEEAATPQNGTGT